MPYSTVHEGVEQGIYNRRWRLDAPEFNMSPPGGTFDLQICLICETKNPAAASYTGSAIFLQNLLHKPQSGRTRSPYGCGVPGCRWGAWNSESRIAIFV